MDVNGHITAYWLLCILFSKVIQGHPLTMITEGQKFVCSVGESVILLCDFHAQEYNLFDYPVLWKKQQHDEIIQVNIMGNLNPPFVTTKRFEVSFTQDVPMHRLELFITDIVPEDSGNYTCEVRGPSSVVITTVTHYVYVKAPIEALTLTAANYTGDSAMVYDDPKYNHKITMIENTLNPLRCSARGGYPAPDLMVKLGGTDITSQFHYNSTPVLTGERGLRHITYQTELWTDSFIANADHDGKKLKCVSSIPNQKPNMTALRLDIHYSPKIICYSISVYEWDRHAEIKCDIWSKPDIKTLSWIIDSNGTTLSAGEVINDFWIDIKEKADSYLQTQLFMTQARPENFRVYTVVAENSVAASSKMVELIKKQRVTSQEPYTEKVNSPSQHRVDGHVDSPVTYSRSNSCSPHPYMFITVLCALIGRW